MPPNQSARGPGRLLDIYKKNPAFHAAKLSSAERELVAETRLLRILRVKLAAPPTVCWLYTLAPILAAVLRWLIQTHLHFFSI
jgi:hypothetical protein